ncbi:MAG: FHA domain-containing protein, partial [Propionibacteriaceae bacterium]|nr:FHA domain-containing protein [Propionibacteriaceae bacterium]
MKIKLTLVTDEGPRDIAVTTDATATIGDVAATMQRSLAFQAGRKPMEIPSNALTLQTLASSGQVERTLLPKSLLTDAGLLSGGTVRVTQATSSASALDAHTAAAAHLHVLSGPDKGRAYPLRSGPNTIGRSPGADVTLNDPFVSLIHARVVVSDHV